MKLLIIESPGKRKKLAEILGDGWAIVASVGHIRDLPINEIGVCEPDYRPTYVLTERGAKVVEDLKKSVSNADVIYLGTDADKEGESIAWHLQEALGLKNALRITFNSVTPEALKKAIQNPRAIDMQLVASQEARRVLDRLVGYRVSPVLSSVASENLSAGRVQSVAVRLVVEREREIKSFRQTKHFGAELYFAGEKKNWSANWILKPDFVNEDSPYFFDREFAILVSQIRDVTVIQNTESNLSVPPPPPYITSTLQQAASVALQADPDKTMEAAQRLYELGHITYHRTDNPNIPDESLSELFAVAVKLGLVMSDKPRKFKADENAQAGHPAITPTDWNLDFAGENELQQALYQMIRRRAIACQIADAQYLVNKVVLEGVEGVSNKVILFQASGRKLIFEGWKKIMTKDDTEEDTETQDDEFPKCEQGQKITAIGGKLLELSTRAPKRYTQASLIKKLDSEGIGRPATYAAILKNVVDREYIKNQQRSLVPTLRGETIADYLVGKFKFIDLAFTRSVEKLLDEIAKGERGYKKTVSEIDFSLRDELAGFTASVKPKFPCPGCGQSLRRIHGKKANEYFWGCTGYPVCSVSLPDKDGEPGQASLKIVSEKNCEKCGKPLVLKTNKKTGSVFWGCTGFTAGCNAVYKYEPSNS